MKIQCDVCEKAPASVICCADEAALCAKCDVEIHAANKLATKHQRLLLQNLSTKLPTCDICQDKPAFIFCVEDRALFCQDCDEPIHSAGSLSAKHQRFLATAIRVSLSSGGCSNGSQKRSSEGPPDLQQSFSSAEWVDDFLRFSPDPESSAEKKDQLGEFDWLNEMGLVEVPDETTAAAEVPQLGEFLAVATTKTSMSFKKPGVETSDEEDSFTVPDLG